jgi:hypothetical protein
MRLSVLFWAAAYVLVGAASFGIVAVFQPPRDEPPRDELVVVRVKQVPPVIPAPREVKR